ncbi:MAG TPA: hypothetical protein VGX68_07605 [Thermoanaerobaculia bacterium]|nr:hypothetical protein [Thermoanaerobaculia bacterium]
MRQAASCWVLATVMILGAGSARAATFRVSLEGDAVVASGVTAKGQVVLLGVTRVIEEDDYPVVRRHLQVLTDDDGDGTVRYPVEGGVPLRSLWAVVDLTSGDHDEAAPEAFGLRRVNWRGRGPQRRPDGKDAVEDRRTLLELLVVRPGAGAWALLVGDGDPSDGDGRIDGRLEGILDRLQPLGTSPAPPSAFQGGDLVLGLDPAALEITVVKVPQNPV